MVQSGRAMPFQRHVQRLKRQPLPGRAAQRPAADRPGEDIQDDSQPSLVRAQADAGDVGYPNLFRACRLPALDQVRVAPKPMLAGPRAAAGLDLDQQVHRRHQLPHPVAAYPQRVWRKRQLRGDPPAAISRILAGDVLDGAAQARIGRGSLRPRPAIIGAARQPKNSQQAFTGNSALSAFTAARFPAAET